MNPLKAIECLIGADHVAGYLWILSHSFYTKNYLAIKIIVQFTDIKKIYNTATQSKRNSVIIGLKCSFNDHFLQILIATGVKYV